MKAWVVVLQVGFEGNRVNQHRSENDTSLDNEFKIHVDSLKSECSLHYCHFKVKTHCIIEKFTNLGNTLLFIMSLNGR